MKKEKQKRVSDDLILDLCHAITKAKNINESAELLSDLLTPHEIHIVAKRLRIASMLIDEFTFDSIVEELKVGKSTVARIHSWLNEAGKGFREAHKQTKKFDKSALKHRRKRVLSDYDRMVRKYGMYHLPEIITEDLKRLKKQKLESALKSITSSKNSSISIDELKKIINENE